MHVFVEDESRPLRRRNGMWYNGENETERKISVIWFLLALILAVLAASYVCFRIAFYAPPRKPRDPEKIEIPQGKIYEVFREDMENWVRQARALNPEPVEIRSFDGLRLTGKYYEYAPGAPMELMFHGYRGGAERDLSGGVYRCFRCGRNALVVDQRCGGVSEGNVITFGIKEHRDCLSWVDFAVKKFGPDVKIILTGISMGASTVLMAGGEELPPNVMGILADCGYSTQRGIMYEVIRKMKLPPVLCYPFVRLAAFLFGGFDLEETSALEAVKRCKVPVIFYHGETDDLVPCYMSRELYDACPTRKRLVTVPDAGHGLAFPVDREKYLAELLDFFGPEGSAR